ncbi:DUF6567 family protein [Nitrosococcus wardiae]|uniref:DUF6567 family protein n=1 Tax=Nitrosococcus wardiae TaxID=1814290 RepID=UPI00197F0011|nr:DUF6567 family protein [Nitrosococcus wardiae]
MWTVTSVNLSKKNYRIVKADVTGSSWGFKLLGLITLKPVSYANAITELYQKAGVSTGKAQALANVSQQKSSPFFILFSIPRITFRADLVEFTEGLPPEGEMGPSSRAKEQSLGGKANPSALE